MTLRLYNTLTRRVDPFVPLEEGHARVYVCGITTYDLAHAGHGRTYVNFDVLVRHLRARGLRVTFVRNTTDVEDKILNRAKELGEEPLALSARMNVECERDLAALGCVVPEHRPKVSEHIGEIVALVERLIERGHAYAVPTDKGSDVYFAVRSFEGYGKLSRRDLEELRVGARVEASEIKRDPLDFVLWKGDGDAWGFESPWGRGRPGWHIECSAMAQKYLGEHFDIHCGGMDLIFPHHENEIAQSEAAYGDPFSQVWMHGGFLNVDREKMSKSLGNFVTIRDILERNDPEAFRYYLLGTHYRGPIGFEVERLENGRVVFPSIDEAERRVEYLYTTLASIDALEPGAFDGAPEAATGFNSQAAFVRSAPEKVLEALDNDLNAPQALAVLAELGKAANELAMAAGKAKKSPAKYAGLRELALAARASLVSSCAPLGLLETSPDAFFDRVRTRRLRLRNLDEAKVQALVDARTEARASRDFARSDALRDELLTLGVEVIDRAGESAWRVIV